MINVLFIIVTKHATKDSVMITGPERRMANIIRSWKPMQINPVICYPDYGYLKDVFTQYAHKVIPFDIKSKFSFNNVSKIRRIIREEKIDLVHTQGAAATDLMATL